jgi:hypothetical protein
MARRERPDRSIPAHPYRDTAIVYGVMALLLVVVAGVTGGNLGRAAVVGAVFWVAATAWSWWRFRGRIRERAVAAAAPAAAAPAVVPALRQPPEAVEGGAAGTAASAGVNGNGRRRHES